MMIVPCKFTGLDHGGLDLFTFEVVELPNGLARIIARCNDFERTAKAGQWLANALDSLWADVCACVVHPRLNQRPLKSPK